MLPVSFIVARTWNTHGDQDFLAGWDARWGTVCAGRGAAFRYASRADAQHAAERAAALLPGFPFTVIPE